MVTHQAAGTKQTGTRFRYFGEIINELKKVIWLSRQEAAYLTILVIIVAVVAGLILGALDYGFAALIDNVFLGR